VFHNRLDAAKQLAGRLHGRPLRDPLVLAIPRGGVVIGAVLARELGAELDVVLSRKLRAPGVPELALGAISEDGEVYLDPHYSAWVDQVRDYLDGEIAFQQSEIARRKALFRGTRPPAPVAGRSVIVTDDGVATGSTMIAALKVLSRQEPHEVIVAVPVGSPDRLKELEQLCDDVVCMLAPEDFHAIGPYYEDFTQVEDDEVIERLRAHARRPAITGNGLP
jgi:predicted phosphoribosyltransferase